MSDAPARCAHTDAMLAHHLDGAPRRDDGDLGLPPGHLEGCAVCRVALGRARRLDAALAEAAGREAAREDPPAARMEGWLDAAVARARVLPQPARMSGPARLLGVAAVFLAGFAAAALLWSRTEEPPTPPAPPPAETAGDDLASGMQPIPLGETSGPIELAPRWPASSLAFLPVPPPVPAGPRLVLQALRAEGALELLEAGRLSSFVRWLAAEPPGPALSVVVARARNHHRLVHGLRARLRTGADERLRQTWTAALRVDSRVLDREVLRLVGDRPELAQRVADALARSPHHGRRTALLLDIWADLVARTDMADDAVTARLVFGAQPAGATADLIEEIRTTRHASRRIRALLALGVRPSPEAVPLLFAHLRGWRFEEAMAAGWSLTQQPVETLEHIAANPRRQDRYLLRAVLAGAKAPQARGWIDAMDLTAEEHAFLRGGSWTPAQFPIAVALFRRASSS